MVGSIQGLESQKKRTDPFIANTQHGTIVMSGVGKNLGINCLYQRESFVNFFFVAPYSHVMGIRYLEMIVCSASVLNHAQFHCIVY